MSYILEVQEDENGDQYIILPDEVIEELGWQEGDVLNWDVRGEGIVISKVNDASGYEVLEDQNKGKPDSHMYYGGESNVPGAPGNLLAGNPSFDIRRTPGALGGRSGEQLRRLYEGGTQQNQQLNDELMRRGIKPGAGPQLPMAFGSSNLPGAIGNIQGMVDAYQLGQAGFNSKFVS